MLKAILVVFVIVAVLGAVSFAVALATKKQGGGGDEPKPDEALPYGKREWLLTKAERSFLGALEAGIGKAGVDVRVMCKVRLADLVFVSKGLERGDRTRAQNRVNMKHVDFVLVSRDEVRPMLVIELDDASHQREDRAKRDVFVDRVFAAAGVRIEHVRAQQAYSVEEMTGLVRGVGRSV